MRGIFLNPQSDQPLLSPAQLVWTAEGEAINARYADIYFSRAGGLAEKYHVFVAGNDLPERFSSGAATRVLEFGFGAGLSFLATAHAMLQSTAYASPTTPPLHYFSIEKHPLSSEDVRRLIAPWPELYPLAEELIAQWPDRVPGFHRRFLAQGRIVLTLIFGDVAEVLPQIDGVFDVFFLDGFSPRLNADMWSEHVLGHLPRLGAPGARVSTYSSARRVMAVLSAVGFEVRRQPGFGGKKHMLTGILPVAAMEDPDLRVEPAPEGGVVIVGAGVAGLTMARALARRGIAVRVFDSATMLGAGGSGNAAGIVSPVISMDWNLRSQLTASGLGFLRADSASLRWTERLRKGDFAGVIQLDRTSKHATRQSAMACALRLDPEFARWLSADDLSAIGDVPVTSSGWFFPRAGWLVPREYLQALADHPLIELNLGTSVGGLNVHDEVWTGSDSAGQRLFVANRVVLANATALEALLPAVGQYITPCRGQVSAALRQANSPGPDITLPLMREGYGLDLPDGRRVFGASFKPGDRTLEVRMSEQLENEVRLSSINPELSRSLTPVSQWQARVSLRATTPDRLPMVGRVEMVHSGIFSDGHPPLYVTAGHGSRGFTWCALLAESLAAEMLGEPGPLPKLLRLALDPTRFARRAARRAGARMD